MVKNTSNAQTFSDGDEHRCVLDIQYLTCWHMRDIERESKDIFVWLSNVDIARGNEEINERVKLILLYPVRI